MTSSSLLIFLPLFVLIIYSCIITSKIFNFSFPFEVFERNISALKSIFWNNSSKYFNISILFDSVLTLSSLNIYDNISGIFSSKDFEIKNIFFSFKDIISSNKLDE